MTRRDGSAFKLLGVACGVALAAASLVEVWRAVAAVTGPWDRTLAITLGLAGLVVASAAVAAALAWCARWRAAALAVLVMTAAAVALLFTTQLSPEARAPSAGYAPAFPRAGKPALLLSGVNLWRNGEVPLCWDDPAGVIETQKALVEGVADAERAWSRAANVRFKDLGACKPGMAAVRLEPDLDANHPDTQILGDPGPGAANLVVLAFAFPSRSLCSRSGDEEILKTCVYGESLHELGHVLGLPDVAYSKNADPACRALVDRAHPRYDIPYDAASVMNVCNPAHIYGRLSDGDVAAVRTFYGPPAAP